MAASNSSSRLPVWRAVLALVWFAGVLVLGVVTRWDPDLRLCDTKVVTKEPSSSSETEVAPEAKVTKKDTSQGATKERTRSCNPVGVPELAALSLPVLVLVLPALKSFSIAGLFSVDLIEQRAAEKATQQATGQVLRVIFEDRFGEDIATSEAQAAAGQVRPLPDE
ncbi:MAG: hypothetical protein QOJ23_4848 [Actinomycetota bacterium]|jgi:hypothetical protein|nr:hypothetical protein [Actinomycetota bacterium]MDQ1500884.1 hypothetical protein [Actinomycetota bacterium]